MAGVFGINYDRKSLYVSLLLLHHPRYCLQRALSLRPEKHAWRFQLSLVGLEVGFLLVYRAGWNIGIAAVLVNVVASLILVPVAIFVFKDKLNWINIVGILVCLVGLVMLNWKR